LSARLSARAAQRLIAAPFLVLGGACLLFPGLVERLSVTPQYYRGDVAAAVYIGCFGAQAVLAGLFSAFSQFTRATFLVYGLALLPFFVFDYWFVFVVPVFNRWLLLDFAANLAMLALCAIGYRASNFNGLDG
jgi:hypothetical protein